MQCTVPRNNASVRAGPSCQHFCTATLLERFQLASNPLFLLAYYQPHTRHASRPFRATAGDSTTNRSPLFGPGSRALNANVARAHLSRRIPLPCRIPRNERDPEPLKMDRSSASTTLQAPRSGCALLFSPTLSPSYLWYSEARQFRQRGWTQQQTPAAHWASQPES